VIGTLTLTPAAAARPALSVPAAGYGFTEGASMQFLAISDVDRELDSVARRAHRGCVCSLTGAGSSLSRVNTTGNTSTSR